MRITYRPTGAVIAEGPLGWGITPFEGNFYIRKSYRVEGRFTPNFIPGLCPYKGLYMWLNFAAPDGRQERGLGWLYWLSNPLFPFIWNRVAVPRHHPDIEVEERTPGADAGRPAQR